MDESKSKGISSRREFLARTAKAGAALALTGFMARKYREMEGPPARNKEAAGQPLLGDYSIPDLKVKMAIARGADRAKMVNFAIAALGGMNVFIKPGDRVLLKVNAAFATPPILGATTHPALVTEVVRLCLGAGASSVVVTDNPINDPATSFELSGIGPAAKKAGADLVLPRAAFFEPYSLEGGRLIRNWPVLLRPLKGIDKLIGLAPAKDHHRSGASMTMKNWYGLLGGPRNIFHQDIHGIIAELARMVKPTLVILDATVAMMTNGPTGGSLADLKPMNTMIVSTDQVATDAFGAVLLGRMLGDVPYIGKAAEAGVGTPNYELLSPLKVQT